MSWHVNQLKYALGFGGMMSFYGAVTLVILFIPPGSFGGRQYQVAVILLVLLTLPFALIMMFVASRRAKKKARLEAEAAQQPAENAPAASGAPAAQSAPVGNYANLTSSAEETVQFLKTSNLGSSGRDAVYSLPWYLVAGAPRAGKSSLVLSSNLNFQTLPSQRQSEQKFIRPTGSVDWRVTSDAVFVDTAGRYQSEGIDAEEWASLLETIKKYRGNRPVDGFLLVVSAETILKSDERQMDELAKVLRARLDETMQRLKVRFPVYVVFTHADAIEGFRDSFSSSKNEDKTLVWGATIPIEKSDNAQALFDSEYEILHNSLMKRRIVRLSAPFAPVRQLRIFNFPLHFGSARRKFGAFVNALFRPNPFSENPFLRGFYFTASPVGKTNGNAAVVGNPYFTERFFRDVVLRDKDLVKTFVEQRQRPPIMGWALTALGTLLVLGLLAMAGVSLYSNNKLLAEAEEHSLKLIQTAKEDKGSNPLDKKPDAARDELERTEYLRQYLAKLDDYDRQGVPWHLRFGLYSGTKVYKEELLPLYLNVVEKRFKQPAVNKIEADLIAFAKSKPVANPSQLTADEEKLLEKNLNLLKAYLMLSGQYKAQAQSAHVANTLREYWLSESKIPSDARNMAEQQLEFWAKQIDRDDVQFNRIQLKPEIVSNARIRLRDYPAEFRYLSRMVSEVSKEIDEALGTPMTVDSILTRNGSNASVMTGSHKVPSAYTRDGLDRMKEVIENADEEMKKDDWVMEEAGRTNVSGNSKQKVIEERYYRDYAIHWVEFVRGIDVKAFKSRSDAQMALEAFSRSSSPMEILIREIHKQTNLSQQPEEDGWWPWLKSYVWKTKAVGPGNSEPEQQFRALVQFVGKKEQGEKVPVKDYNNQLAKMSKTFNKQAGSDNALRKIQDLMAADDQDPLDLKGLETEISSLIGVFEGSQAAQELSSLLMEPVAELRAFVGGGVVKQLEKAWADQVLPAAKLIEKGYPFEDGGSEADLKNLQEFLAPNEGKLSKFYNEKLASYFEVANGLYRPIEGSGPQFTPEFVTYLNNAFALQKALFGSSTSPKFEYEFKLNPVKDAIIEISIDGQKPPSDGTGSMKGVFPSTGAETGVILRVAPTGGAALPPPPSANSSNSNVSTVSGTTPAASSSEIVEPGQWGLFKFVDRGSPERRESGEYQLTYKVGGKAVTATIKPIGSGDLFNKKIFRDVKAPQTFLKAN